MGTLAIASLIALMPASALGQNFGTATYIIDVENPVLAPGQSTMVHVLVSFEPGIGRIISNGTSVGPVLGLSDGGYHLSGLGSPDVNGGWSGLHFAPAYAFALGNQPGTPSGLSVNGIIWGTGLVQPPHPSPNNPDIIWHCTFTAGASSAPGTVTLWTTSMSQIGVFFGGPIPSVALYKPMSGSAQITIIPAPTVLGPVSIVSVLVLRRRG